MSTTVGTISFERGDPVDGPPDPPPASPTRRPALRFVAALAGLIVVLAGLRWTGAVAPRATLATGVPSASNLSYDAATGWGWVAFDVRNGGALPVRVATVDLPSRRSIDDQRVLLRDAGVPADGRIYPGLPADADDVPSLTVFEPFELPGRSQREIVLLVHVTCRGSWPTDIVASAADPLPDVSVTVSSAAGLDADLRVPGYPRRDRLGADGC